MKPYIKIAIAITVIVTFLFTQSMRPKNSGCSPTQLLLKGRICFGGLSLFSKGSCVSGNLRPADVEGNGAGSAIEPMEAELKEKTSSRAGGVQAGSAGQIQEKIDALTGQLREQTDNFAVRNLARALAEIAKTSPNANYTQAINALTVQITKQTDYFAVGDLATALAEIAKTSQQTKEALEAWIYNYIFDPENAGLTVGKDIKGFSSIWDEYAETDIKLNMPFLFNILQDKNKITRFLFVLSILRLAYPFNLANGQSKGPIAWSKDNNAVFRVGRTELYIAPVTESFRRHIVYTEKEGKTFAIEIKMPGQYEDRDAIWPNHFTIAKEMHDKYGKDSRVVKPAFFISLKGRFNLYEREFDFTGPYPLGIAGFYYQDGKRYKNISNALIASIAKEKGISEEEVRASIAIEILVTVIRLHQLGYQGSTDAGNDMHLENFRLLSDGSAISVADFGAFEKYTGDRVSFLVSFLQIRQEETKAIEDELGVSDRINDIFPEITAKLLKGIDDTQEQLALVNEAIDELGVDKDKVAAVIIAIETGSTSRSRAMALPHQAQATGTYDKGEIQGFISDIEAGIEAEDIEQARKVLSSIDIKRTALSLVNINNPELTNTIIDFLKAADKGDPSFASKVTKAAVGLLENLGFSSTNCYLFYADYTSNTSLALAIYLASQDIDVIVMTKEERIFERLKLLGMEHFLPVDLEGEDMRGYIIQSIQRAGDVYSISDVYFCYEGEEYTGMTAFEGVNLNPIPISQINGKEVLDNLLTQQMGITLSSEHITDTAFKFFQMAQAVARCA